MSTFKISLKLFFRSTFLSILSSVYFLFFCISIPVYYFIFRNDIPEPLHFLTITLLIATFLPVLFLFISYEYFHKAKNASLYECIRGIKNGLLKTYCCQFGVLAIFALLLTLILMLEHIFIYLDMQIQSTEYLLHLLKNIFLNVFLVSLTSILLGLVAALALKRVPAYLLMITFALIGAGVFYPLFIGLYRETGCNVYPFLDLFSFTAPSIKWQENGHFGYSLLSYQYQRLGIWIFGALAVFFYQVSQRKKSLLRAMSAIFLAACIGCTIFFYLPASKVNMELRHPNSSIGDNYYLQHQNVMKEEDGGFQITSYDLDFQIGRQLKAKATLTVDQPKLNTYKLTLYHGYRVKSAANQDGVPLLYTQDGDYITVNRGSEAVEQIILTYAGSNSQCYANQQGIFLPGQFIYFPHSGYHAVMQGTNDKTSDFSFKSHLLPESTYFHVTTNLRHKIYSNLQEQPDGSFAGTADSLTLISGFLNEIESEGVRIVYSYLDYPEELISYISEQLHQFLAKKQDDRTYTALFIMPNMNLGSTGQLAVFNDYINAYLPALTVENYEKQFIPVKKLPLYSVLHSYINNRDDYESNVAYWQGIDDPNRNPNENEMLLFNKTLQTIGEEAMLPACQAYLQDNHDTRTVIEFLQSLQN